MIIKKFSLSVLLFSICLLLSGCASLLHIPEEGKFTAVGNYPEMKVTWLAVENTTAKCKELFPETMNQYYLIPAGAGWNKTECIVVTGKVTTNQILGHEFRHCFEGLYHK
jgi:hypothetical protein